MITNNKKTELLQELINTVGEVKEAKVEGIYNALSNILKSEDESIERITVLFSWHTNFKDAYEIHFAKADFGETSDSVPTWVIATNLYGSTERSEILTKVNIRLAEEFSARILFGLAYDRCSDTTLIRGSLVEKYIKNEEEAKNHSKLLHNVD